MRPHLSNLLITDPEPSKWYLAVICGNCHSRSILVEDLSNGISEIEGTYFLTCPKCNHEAQHEIERYHHPKSAATSN